MTQLIDDLFQVHAKKDNGPKKSLNLADYKKKRGLIWSAIRIINIPGSEQEYYVACHDFADMSIEPSSLKISSMLIVFGTIVKATMLTPLISMVQSSQAK